CSPWTTSRAETKYGVASVGGANACLRQSCRSRSTQLALPDSSLVRFPITLDAITELAVVGRKLTDHLVDAARRQSLCRAEDQFHLLANSEFVIAHVSSSPPRLLARCENARSMAELKITFGPAFPTPRRCHTRVKVPSGAWLAHYDSASVYRGRFRRILI